jgi:hypothetical protein
MSAGWIGAIVGALACSTSALIRVPLTRVTGTSGPDACRLGVLSRRCRAASAEAPWGYLSAPIGHGFWLGIGIRL